jgi:ABC-2 type transport system ATP-binding protein
MIAIDAAGLAKTYWYYEKEPGLSGALRGLFRARRTPIEAVRDLNFEVRLGEVVGLIGPNGAGKTTTLKMLCGILHPSEGSLTVLGFNPSRREKAFLKGIAYVSGQRNRLFWDLPAEDYFRFCKAVYEIPDDLYERNRRRGIEVAEIGDILTVPQRKLSFGQRKRCELAAVLLHDPKLILLDEPTNAMDILSAGRVRQFIREEAREGNRAVIVTSHNMSDIEGVCERVTTACAGTSTTPAARSSGSAYDSTAPGGWNPCGSWERSPSCRRTRSPSRSSRTRRPGRPRTSCPRRPSGTSASRTRRSRRYSGRFTGNRRKESDPGPLPQHRTL